MVTVTQDLKLIQASWAKYDNSIMINGWNDMKHKKPSTNICLFFKLDIIFIRAMDAPTKLF
jgi:hypothetical protein